MCHLVCIHYVACGHQETRVTNNCGSGDSQGNCTNFRRVETTTAPGRCGNCASAAFYYSYSRQPWSTGLDNSGGTSIGGGHLVGASNGAGYPSASTYSYGPDRATATTGIPESTVNYSSAGAKGAHMSTYTFGGTSGMPHLYYRDAM